MYAQFVIVGLPNNPVLRSGVQQPKSWRQVDANKSFNKRIDEQDKRRGILHTTFCPNILNLGRRGILHTASCLLQVLSWRGFTKLSTCKMG